MEPHGFPAWLRITHYVNFFFMILLVRSGLQILADHPRLYWNVHCTPGTEWLRLTPVEVPKDRLWTAKDDSRYLSPWIGLPGCVDYAKLIRISMKIGMAESARYLSHQRGWVSRLLTRQFKPTRLLDGLAQVVEEPDTGVAGFHLYTFNEVGPTERWRQRAIARLGTRRAT